MKCQWASDSTLSKRMPKQQCSLVVWPTKSTSSRATELILSQLSISSLYVVVVTSLLLCHLPNLPIMF
jgi:hypothetical protein